jgi:GntR family transcriptional regulator, negative regulator for fad regulon and positive regulator of fabA
LNPDINWEPPQKPGEIAETRLIQAILEKIFPIHSSLPGERDLAEMLGVTRPTLRETLQRLARDGWIEIQHGKPTRVRDYWQEGSLGVLATLARYPEYLPTSFILQLLQVRSLLAPAYTLLAIKNQPEQIAETAKSCEYLPETPAAFASFDWQLHSTLTIASGNPVFTLILNGFRDLYPVFGSQYFAIPQTRQVSRGFYQQLAEYATAHNSQSAALLTQSIMEQSVTFWETLDMENLRTSEELNQ